ncbi:MAG: hypothetical protein GX102_06030 [Porphyromonadaceae bacterium]|nr:hypothetical protein [Porphyromonadaceae bacterium]
MRAEDKTFLETRRNRYLSMLSSAMGRNEVDWLCRDALSDIDNFEFLFDLIFSHDNQIAWRAAWVIEKVSEKSIENFKNTHKDRLQELILTSSHGGLRRLVLSIIFNLPLRQPISVEFINRCFEQMMLVKEPVSVQVLSMKILEKVCEIEHDLSQELETALLSLDSDLFSKGFVAARKGVIKRLKMRV